MVFSAAAVLPFVVLVAFVSVLLIWSSVLWFYRRPIVAHLGKPGMALLVLGLAGFFLLFVLNIALMVSRLLMY